jgi:hypothetical protein
LSSVKSLKATLICGCVGIPPIPVLLTVTYRWLLRLSIKFNKPTVLIILIKITFGGNAPKLSVVIKTDF